MFRGLALLGFSLIASNANASCAVQSILHDRQIDSLKANEYVDLKTNHAYQILNDSSIIQNYWLCRKMLIKNASGSESYTDEVCYAVSLKPLKSYSLTLPLIKQVHFSKKGEYVSLTITTKISVDCESESVVNKVLKVY